MRGLAVPAAAPTVDRMLFGEDGRWVCVVGGCVWVGVLRPAGGRHRRCAGTGTGATRVAPTQTIFFKFSSTGTRVGSLAGKMVRGVRGTGAREGGGAGGGGRQGREGRCTVGGGGGLRAEVPAEVAAWAEEPDW